MNASITLAPLEPSAEGMNASTTTESVENYTFSIIYQFFGYHLAQPIINQASYSSKHVRLCEIFHKVKYLLIEESYNDG